MKRAQIAATESPWGDLVTHDGLFAVDGKQRIVHWSDNAQRIIGLGRDEVMGKPCYEIIGGRDYRNYQFCRKNCPVLANARRGRPTPDYDILVGSSEVGNDKWLNVTVAVPRRNRWPFEVVHFFRDVTQRRQTEEFAHKAGLALRELLTEEVETRQQETLLAPPPPPLSRREIEVLRLLAAGLGTREIADSLAVQPVTARNHITRVLNKLGVESRLQAVVYASQHGLI